MYLNIQSLQVSVLDANGQSYEFLGFKPQFKCNLDGRKWPFVQSLLKCEYRNVVLMIKMFLRPYFKCQLKGAVLQAIFRSSSLAVLLQHRLREKLPNVTHPEVNLSSEVLAPTSVVRKQNRKDCGNASTIRFVFLYDA